MAGTRRQWHSEDGVLAPEVAHVCVNGIREFERKYRAHEVHQLGEIVKRRYGKVERKSSDFAKQLNEIFSDAIQQLERHEQLAAAENFGLRGSESYRRQAGREARQRKAAQEYGNVINKKIAADTYRQKPQYERTIIINVGREIEKQDAEATEQKERNRAESGPLGTHKQYTTPYVHRLDYHAAFEAKLGEGWKIIAFVGPPGVGKTRLVDQILADRVRAGDSRLYFECGDPGRFISDIAVKLQSPGVQAGHLTDGQLRRNFISFICSWKAPTYIVLHDLRNVDLLRDVDPMKLATVIVVVSNCYFADIPHVATIGVSPLLPHEAMKMARHLLPDICDSDLRQLIGTVGCSPQALENAAVFLSSQASSLTVNTFCRAFTRNADLILRNANSDLLERFQDTFKALRGSQLDAADILEHLVFLADLIPLELIVASIADKNNIAREDIDVVRQVALRALEVLQENSLISFDDGYVKLYKLAQVIGPGLINSEKRDEIARRLRSIIREQIALVSREQRKGPRSAEKFMDAARLVVNHLFHVEKNMISGRNYEKAGRETAKVIRDLYGDFDLGPLVEIVPLVEEDEFLMQKLTFRFGVTPAGKKVREQLEKMVRETEL